MVATTISTPRPPNGEPGGSEFRREMQLLASDASPAAAVVASLSRVEQALRDLLVADGANDLERLNSGDLVRLARHFTLRMQAKPGVGRADRR